jgi:hypothetical protein
MKGGGGAAETLVMHDQFNNAMRPLTPTGPTGPNSMPNRGRMSLAALFAVLVVAASHSLATGQVMNAGYEADYEASGFVAPAGMPSPDAYYSQVEQASFFGPSGPIASRAYGCDGGCGDSSCDGGCGSCGCEDGSCGMGGGCGGCGAEGCPSCGGLTNLRYACLFCRGGGCSVCQSIGRGYLLGALASLLPYRDAGICAQRWYDVSGDVMFLGHTRGTGGQVLTTQGISGTPVLRASDADNDDLEAGARISASFIFGAGGSIEGTYMGGQEWEGSASANSATPTLFSFLSEFGTAPGGNVLVAGFDDSDRSLRQSVSTYSTFHSAEFNYRRRTVEQYCRFQGSWLVGLRYLRFDDDFRYATAGAFDNAGNASQRFLNFSNGVDNKMFGPQAGFDLWWNVIAGVNLGFGAKGAWLDNNIDRHSSLFANSIGPGGTPGQTRIEDGRNKSTVMGEFDATMLYRISHSWTLKGQYYVLAVEDMAYGFDVSPALNVFSQGATPVSRINTDSFTLQGFGFGAEYIW